jgi:hypothetical protein
MKLFKRLVPVVAVTALTALLSGCYELHIAADINTEGAVSAASLEMRMDSKTFEALAPSADATADLAGFEKFISTSIAAEDAPAAAGYMNDCKYDLVTEGDTKFYTADCALPSTSDAPITADSLLGLTGGSTTVNGSTMTVTGTMADNTGGDPEVATSAGDLGLVFDSTLKFPGKVTSVEGVGVSISKDDPNSVVVDFFAASSQAITISSEITDAPTPLPAGTGEATAGGADSASGGSNFLVTALVAGVWVLLVGGLAWFGFRTWKKRKPKKS